MSNPAAANRADSAAAAAAAGPSRGISTPQVSAGARYPVPEGGAPLGIVAG